VLAWPVLDSAGLCWPVPSSGERRACGILARCLHSSALGQPRVWQGRRAVGAWQLVGQVGDALQLPPGQGKGTAEAAVEHRAVWLRAAICSTQQFACPVRCRCQALVGQRPGAHKQPASHDRMIIACANVMKCHPMNAVGMYWKGATFNGRACCSNSSAALGWHLTIGFSGRYTSTGVGHKVSAWPFVCLDVLQCGCSNIVAK
jgi:hypothetical protein